MANTVRLKRSGTPSATPSSLEHGELAINYADGIVFWKSSSNTIKSFEFINYLPNASVSTFGKSLIDDADAATARTTLGAAASASPAITGAATFANSGNVVPVTITNTGTANSFVVNDESGDATPFVVDAAGNVGVGTASPAYALDVTGQIRTTGQLLADDSTSTSAPVFSFDGDTNTGIGRPAADVVAVSTGGSERMRVGSDGTVLINGPDSGGWTSSKLLVTGGYSQFKHTDAPVLIWNTTDSGSRQLVYFSSTVSGTRADLGSISTNGSTITYGGTSDYRLKKSITNLENATERLARIRPVAFVWKTTGIADEGFLAHELADVCPNAVVGEKDAIFADGRILAQQVDSRSIVPLLVKAVQESNARIAALEERLNG